MSYRALARSAPVAFFPLGLLARLPYAITPLGSLLVLQHATGGHAFAGLAAGAQSIAIAVAGFAAGGLAVRFGVRKLGMALAVLNALAVVLLVVASASGSRPAMLCGAIMVGLTQPHVGLLARVHWSRSLDHTTTAFAYESAVDELSFVIGPAVVGLFAAVRPGDGPLLGMVLLLLAAAAPFAAMYTRDAAPRQVSARRLPVRRMGLLMAAMAAVGAIFGSIQVATAAQAGSGFRYALLGVGSAISGVVYGWLPTSFRVDTRYLVFSVTLVVGMAVLAVSPSPLGILVAGFFVAPYMITLYALTDTLAPPARLPVAMAALGAGGPIGTAIGQTVTGPLVDGPGLGVAWFVPVGCACVGLLIASGQQRSRHRRRVSQVGERDVRA
jgi:hypothetical protein